MIREVKARLGEIVIGLCVLLVATTAHAHLLNMTDIHLDASDPDAVLLHVKIDLGQSLLSPSEYWRAVNSEPDAQLAILEPAVTRLSDGLEVLVNGQRVSASLQSWDLQAASLEAIENSLAPQMAILTFGLDRSGLDTSADYTASFIEVRIDELLEVPWPALLRVDSATRDLPVSRLLTANDRRSRPVSLMEGSEAAGDSSMLASLALNFQSWTSGLGWLAIGFQHIVPWGLDHIVFVLGLFFLSTRLSTLFYQVSCFTVAHSITLGLATFGVISTPAALVEPLIAASIIFIAVDNLYSSEFLARWRLLVVTLFGLLHGLGFASALSELMLPAENFTMALLLFNLGVEAGQITVLVLAFVAVGWLRSWAAYSERVARPATITIAGIGTYWFLKRIAF